MSVAAVLLLGCPQQIGDRCGPDLPPCPNGFACLDGLCREGGAAGGAGGGAAAGGGTAGGGTAGGNVDASTNLAAPVMTMTMPPPGVIVGGAMTTLSGVITQSAGREVLSATIEARSW